MINLISLNSVHLEVRERYCFQEGGAVKLNFFI